MKSDSGLDANRRGESARAEARGSLRSAKSARYNPLWQLITTRIRQFFREPEAIFWTYGFPLLMIIGLGIAFRNKVEPPVAFVVVEGTASAQVTVALADNERFEVEAYSNDKAFDRLKNNKTPVVVTIADDGLYEYHFDPSNPDSKSARDRIDDALQRAAGRQDVIRVKDRTVTAPGSRYIDFLVPGLIGMNLMSGGMWGIGFVLVDMRVRNLLKRLLATPMRRSHFLLSMVGWRAMFFIPEMLFLLGAAFLIFRVPVTGSLLSLMVVAFVGALSFCGLGLLTACRAKRIETISGLMNLVMLPMWLMSGIFFSSDRFPDFLQPFIQALPLTLLINALRAVMLNGESLLGQTGPLLALAAWGGISFVLALRWFRWN